MTIKIGKRPKLTTFLKKLGWQSDGWCQDSQVFKHMKYPDSRILIDDDEYHWSMVTWPDLNGQVGGKGKASFVAQLKAEGQLP